MSLGAAPHRSHSLEPIYIAHSGYPMMVSSVAKPLVSPAPSADSLQVTKYSSSPDLQESLIQPPHLLSCYASEEQEKARTLSLSEAPATYRKARCSQDLSAAARASTSRKTGYRRSSSVVLVKEDNTLMTAMTSITVAAPPRDHQLSKHSSADTLIHSFSDLPGDVDETSSVLVLSQGPSESGVPQGHVVPKENMVDMYALGQPDRRKISEGSAPRTARPGGSYTGALKCRIAA